MMNDVPAPEAQKFEPFGRRLLIRKGALETLGRVICLSAKLNTRGANGQPMEVSVDFASAMEIAREAVKRATGATAVSEQGEVE